LQSVDKLSKEPQDQFDHELDKNERKSAQRCKLEQVIPEYVDNYFMTKKLILLENMTLFPFWTSDNPVVLYNPNISPFGGNLGIGSSGIKIICPINPKLSLMFLDSDYYTEYNDNEKIRITDIGKIAEYNMFQIVYSTRHIYSDICEFSLAQTSLFCRPEWRDPPTNIQFFKL
jgi:hypothetical protein